MEQLTLNICVIVIFFIIYGLSTIVGRPTCKKRSFSEFRFGRATESAIPKKIWTFWDSDDLPRTVKKCIDTWRFHCPDYEIVILNKNNLSTYLTNIDVLTLKFADTPQRIADFVRVCVLPIYGGIWMDATIMLNDDLSWIHATQKETNAETIGYYLEAFTTIEAYPVMESWFFACIPGSPFISLWRDEFLRMNDFDTVEDYVHNVRDVDMVDIQKIYSPYYLAIHVAAQKVMQKMNDEFGTLYFYKAEDGPYKYLFGSGWKCTEALINLCNDPCRYATPVIKFRGGERGILEGLRGDLGLRKCILG